MDTTQALKDAENALRDFIADLLFKSFGNGWEEKCGVSTDRIEKWRERKIVEGKRQETGVADERLLYYADFFDLKVILKKHWSIFSPALGDLKTFEVWLGELEKLRDPDAHRRELLPHQHHLALGISGEIRTRIVRFRSMQETSDSYFSRIDCIRDSLGNIWTPDIGPHFNTKKNVRPGDTIDLVVTASDPMGDILRYGIETSFGNRKWQESNTFSYTFQETDVSRLFKLSIAIKSPRAYHAISDFDQFVDVFYCVLPPK